MYVFFIARLKRIKNALRFDERAIHVFFFSKNRSCMCNLFYLTYINDIVGARYVGCSSRVSKC